MEMEVRVPVPRVDFNFNSALSSPRTSAPSTPRRIGDYYFSAPTSPGRLSDFYHEFDEFLITNSGGGSSSVAVPFGWEEKPGTPKSPTAGNTAKYEDDFAFDVSGEFLRNSVSAEELFDGGIIKPLKPPPRSQQLLAGGENEPLIQKGHGLSPRSHRSSPLSQGKRISRGAFSPGEKKDYNPFESNSRETPGWGRGRESVSSLTSSSRRGRARSLSPLRDPPQYPWDQEEEEQQTKHSTTTSSKPSLASTTPAMSKGHRKWRLMDFFLFRSASDGRAMDKDPLKKYSPFFRKHEDFRNSTIESPGSGSNSRRRGSVSAHELHYKVNRAVSEDMKKKTFLPYKQGILGRLAFNPAVHALANGFGFSRR